MKSTERPVLDSFQSRQDHRRIIAGTRGSALAQWQTRHVIEMLNRVAPEIESETRIIKTQGDKDQTRSLADIGGLGVFTKEIENALLAREIDFAVHSLKDLPTEIAPGLAIAAISAREDPRDCLVSRNGVGLNQLPSRARVGTSSLRRAAQLLLLRPDLAILPLRGNVDTRLRKAHSNEYDAIVLAAAGVIRLGRADEITEYLSLDRMLPDPGQGALAIEIRADDEFLNSVIQQLDDSSSRAAVTAERALLQALGGGCRMPLGTFAELKDGALHIKAVLAYPDGSHGIQGELTGPPDQAHELGAQLGRKLLGAGGAELVEKITKAAGNSDLSETNDTRVSAQALTRLPLQGKRILVTRSREQASTLVEKIVALGGEPIQAPTIAVERLSDFRDLDAELARLAEYNWIVFTSANGVRAVFERLEELGLGTIGLSSRRIAAIGPATSQALNHAGLQVAFVPTRYLGAQIALELPVQPGEKALLLRADIASDELANGLTARGVRVVDVDAYRTVAPHDASINLAQIDAVTLTSSSTARNLVSMLDEKGRNALVGTPVVCIGPVTAETARSLGLKIAAVAAEHTVDGLVNELINLYQGKSHA